MLKNYLTTALRALHRQRSYAVINILGLALGLICFFFIAFYLQHELSYDGYHEHADRLFRIAVEERSTAGVQRTAGTPYPLAPVLRQNYPELATTARYFDFGRALVATGDKKLIVEKFSFAEPAFLQIFSFRLLNGSREQALVQPKTMLLTKSMAERIFGTANPIGQTIRVDNKIDLTVTGILDDVQTNTHFRFDCLASFDAINKEFLGIDPEQWGAYIGTYTYTRLPAGIDATAVSSNIASAIEHFGGSKPGITYRLFLQPVADIHLYSTLDDELAANSNPTTLFVMASLAVLILLIACFNFMNLATARSARRAREVGLRKVLGAERRQLLGQFLGEAVLLAGIALAIAFSCIELLWPLFNSLAGTSLNFSYSEHSGLILLFVAVTVAAGVLSGIYPAVVLAAYQPVETLKGGQTPTGAARTSTMRRALVVAQFVISIVLIATTLIIDKQLRFLQQADVGFHREQIVMVSMNDALPPDKQALIKSEWRSHANIAGVAAAYKSPIWRHNFGTSLFPRGIAAEERFNINLNFIDEAFLPLFGIPLLAGRNFVPENTHEAKRALIINEAAVAALGLKSPEAAIGKVYRIGINEIDGTVIGVVADFHIATLHDQIEPLVMLYWPELFNVFALRIQPHDIPATLASIEASWQRHVPNFPLEYTFLDQYIDGLYQSEQRTRNLVRTFSGLAIFIACLGLFGLAALAAQQRQREVGIRKVLGASVPNLLRLLTGDFIRPVAVAILIALPISWMAAQRWLAEFAYRTVVGWEVFALAALLALAIAVLTVSFQAAKSALTNPVKVLRNE